MNANYFKIEEVMTNDPELVEEAKNRNAAKLIEPEDMVSNIKIKQDDLQEEIMENLAKCPSCGSKSLKIEGGCHSCVNEKCGYSKCDI
jgi:Zn finger protein HypA/HybF involved in hydrogenase expression